MKHNENKIPTRKTELWKFDTKYEVLIFDTRDFKIKFFQLNRIGSMIWALCDGKTTINDIISDLWDSFKEDIGISRDRLKEDVQVFICELEKEDLIVFKEKTND